MTIPLTKYVLVVVEWYDSLVSPMANVNLLDTLLRRDVL